MHNHFFQHLNLRKIILEKRPKVIVEVGAGNGDNTRLLAHLLDQYPFELHVISDKKIEGLDPRIKWTTGISYKELAKYADGSIDLCIIDTDHNFWTLKEELRVVKDKISEGGLMAFHDVDEFYHNNGMALSYWEGTPYPEKEILECVKFGGIGDALLKFLVDYNSQFKLLYWMPEKFGAALVEKKTITQTQVITAGAAPVFAQQVPEAVGA